MMEIPIVGTVFAAAMDREHILRMVLVTSQRVEHVKALGESRPVIATIKLCFPNAHHCQHPDRKTHSL
jgi:hypothetical protein